jgi:ketosteroid isomerase-like protein
MIREGGDDERCPTRQGGAAMSQNVDTVKGLYASFGQGDIPAVLSGFADDIDWSAPASVFGDPAHAHGREGVGAFFSLLPGYFPELHVEPKEYVDGGDTVVAIGHHVGRGAKGSFDADFVHVWTFRGGKVTSFHEVADTALITAAI